MLCYFYNSPPLRKINSIERKSDVLSLDFARRTRFILDVIRGNVS